MSLRCGPAGGLVVHNDPVNKVDPTGEYADLAIEAVSIGLGAASAAENISEGNFGAAAVDVGGIVFDAAAAIVPGLPGAAGIGIKAAREGGKAATKAAKSGAAAERAKNVAKSVPESKLGPSGKPKQHTVTHSTRKSAHQAAKKEADRAGGSVRNDANPANDKQGPHFQAEDAKGENVKPVVHHERPD